MDEPIPAEQCLEWLSYSHGSYLVPRIVWQDHGMKIIEFLESLHHTELQFSFKNDIYHVWAPLNLINQQVLEQWVVYSRLRWRNT